MTTRTVTCILMLGILGAAASCTSDRVDSAPSNTSTFAQSLTEMCTHPTRSASTHQTIAVAAPNAPRIGPLSVHPYPYAAGYPTKVLLHPVREVDATLHLTGQSCRDERALRFIYGSVGLPAGQPPYSEQQLGTLGTTDAELPPQAGDSDYTGYMLFSETGPWIVVLSRAGRVVGSILINVG